MLTLGVALATYGIMRFGYSKPGQDAGRPRSAMTALTSRGAASFPLRTRYVGMATKTPFQRTLPAIEHILGRKPGIVELYMAFGHGFPLAQIEYLDKLKILPLIQINPKSSNLQQIGAGKFDSYLQQLADAARKVAAPVALSFAHEMNGWWYPWSVIQPTPRQVRNRPRFFISAWRHIHDVFAAAHATNVIWVWTISRDGTKPGWPGLSAWWPGARYVNWVGMNGYYRRPGETFDYLYQQQLIRLRTFTSDPVLITETGAGPGPVQSRQIADLFAGVARTKGMLGFVWFDLNADKQWNINSNQVAIDAFRAGIARYGD